jgi:hypothetical protein
MTQNLEGVIKPVGPLEARRQRNELSTGKKGGPT